MAPQTCDTKWYEDTVSAACYNFQCLFPASCHLESHLQPFYFHRFTIVQWCRLSISVLMVTFGVLHVVATELQSQHSSSIQAESYFREPTASDLLHTHIALISLAWICALPICSCLSYHFSSLAERCYVKAWAWTSPARISIAPCRFYSSACTLLGSFSVWHTIPKL